jgi:2-oxoglutarate ferredoxin oxidoreductase subunit beta
MTFVVMDNFVYGLTKKQTSPTSPIGFKSKTDLTGSLDQPVNPMKKLIAAGASFIARSHAQMPAHLIEMMDKAMDHQGFSVIECLSECTEFFSGAFDAALPRKGGAFTKVPDSHDVTDEVAAYKLALEPFPGYFGIFYQVRRATKNENEQKLIDTARAATQNATPLALLQKMFDRMK